MTARILVVDDEALPLAETVAVLRGAGFDVTGCQHPTLAVAQLREEPAALVLADQQMPVMGGRELIRALAAFPETKDIPVALMGERDGAADELRAIAAGAVALFRRPLSALQAGEVQALLLDLRGFARLPQADRVVTRFLSRFLARRATGAVVVNAGTPFEGRVSLVNGEVQAVIFGDLAPTDALRDLLATRDGAFRFEVGTPPDDEGRTPTTQAGSARPARVLIVDDEPSLRHLWAKQLEVAGFDVSVADDGQQGFNKAADGDFDIIVADLAMPVLDGWGLLAALKADPRTCEVPVLVLSAQAGFREGLKAVQAGAHSFLSKSGHARELVTAVRTLATHRAEVVDALEHRRDFEVDLRQVGALWLLRAIGQSGVTVRVETTDELATTALTCASDRLVEASARGGGRIVRGVEALARFAGQRNARAKVVSTEVSSLDGPSLSNAVDEVVRRLSRADKALLERRIKSSTGFEFDPALLSLMMEVGSEADLALLRALFERRVPPERLPGEVGQPPAEVRARLLDLVRRGVLMVKDSPADPAGAS